jgi:hypothetical protein
VTLGSGLRKKEREREMGGRERRLMKKFREKIFTFTVLYSPLLGVSSIFSYSSSFVISLSHHSSTSPLPTDSSSI